MIESEIPEQAHVAPAAEGAKPETLVTSARPLRKTRVGEVVSDKMDKTIVVESVTRVPHRRFGKIIKQVKKFYVHDERNEAKIGDRVAIMETSPRSRLKRWRLVEILKH